MTQRDRKASRNNARWQRSLHHMRRLSIYSQRVGLKFDPKTLNLALDKGTVLELVWALHSRVNCYWKRDLLERTAKGLPERLDI